MFQQIEDDKQAAREQSVLLDLLRAPDAAGLKSRLERQLQGPNSSVANLVASSATDCGTEEGSLTDKGSPPLLNSLVTPTCVTDMASTTLKSTRAKASTSAILRLLILLAILPS